MPKHKPNIKARFTEYFILALLNSSPPRAKPLAGQAKPGIGTVDSGGALAIVRSLRAGGVPLSPRAPTHKRRIPMFAVIRTGGKQYKVAKDDLITVERLTGEPGASVTLDDVLMVGEGAQARVTPAGAQVTAEVVKQVRGDKVLIFKKKRRHNYRRKNGHRQHLTVLRVTGISAGK
jgi:large subunit ribosomal protein L21